MAADSFLGKADLGVMVSNVAALILNFQHVLIACIVTYWRQKDSSVCLWCEPHRSKVVKIQRMLALAIMITSFLKCLFVANLTRALSLDLVSLFLSFSQRLVNFNFPSLHFPRCVVLQCGMLEMQFNRWRQGGLTQGPICTRQGGWQNKATGRWDKHLKQVLWGIGPRHCHLSDYGSFHLFCIDVCVRECLRDDDEDGRKRRKGTVESNNDYRRSDASLNRNISPCFWNTSKLHETEQTQANRSPYCITTFVWRGHFGAQPHFTFKWISPA